MATLQNTDKIIVNRDGETYFLRFQDLKESISSSSNGYTALAKSLMRTTDSVHDDDLFVVERAGDPYTVTYKEIVDSLKPQIAPLIDNVQLVENNPGVTARFTDQSFTTTVTMADQGYPMSAKTIDAYIEGAIFSDVQFDETIESIPAVPSLPAELWSKWLFPADAGGWDNNGAQAAFQSYESPPAKPQVQGTRIDWGYNGSASPTNMPT